MSQDAAGSLFGSVYPDNGPGYVFKVGPEDNSFTVLHEFNPASKDGSQSASRLLVSGAVIFGTTKAGGSNNLGTVFRMGLEGQNYQVLHHFGSVAGDGQYPYSGLVSASDGTLFGTTISGGNSSRGTVYKVRPDGSGYQVLHQFGPSFGTNGAYPYGGLLIGSNDVLFGTTFSGGTSGYGNIFRLKSDGSDYQIMHQFVTGDGNSCYAALIRGGEGYLYGATSAGGVSNQGAIFRIREDGTSYSILASVGTSMGEGRQIYQALALGMDDMLYGITSSGGANNSGTLFRIGKNGSDYRTVLHFRTNEFASSDLFVTQTGQFYGAVQNTGGGETGGLWQFVMPSLRAMGVTENGFHLRVFGTPGMNLTLETTADFSTWATWLTTNLTSASLDVLDTNAPVSARFFRIK